jgi:hypothetical protein
MAPAIRPGLSPVMRPPPPRRGTPGQVSRIYWPFSRPNIHWQFSRKDALAPVRQSAICFRASAFFTRVRCHTFWLYDIQICYLKDPTESPNPDARCRWITRFFGFLRWADDRRRQQGMPSGKWVVGVSRRAGVSAHGPSHQFVSRYRVRSGNAETAVRGLRPGQHLASRQWPPRCRK